MMHPRIIILSINRRTAPATKAKRRISRGAPTRNNKKKMKCMP